MIRAELQDACEANIDALTRGWSETIDYNVMRNRKKEKRTKQRDYGPLLTELRTRAMEPITATSSGPSYNPNHSTSRPPYNQAMLDLVDTIHEQADRVHRWLSMRITLIEMSTAPKRSPESCLYAIRAMVRTTLLTDAELASTLQTTTQLVSQARQMLGYDVRRVMLANMVCHECGGALGVAEDASTDVKCMGSPTAPPCGNTYSRMQWLDLMSSA